jgi:hypothetical protein
MVAIFNESEKGLVTSTVLVTVRNYAGDEGWFLRVRQSGVALSPTLSADLKSFFCLSSCHHQIGNPSAAGGFEGEPAKADYKGF